MPAIAATTVGLSDLVAGLQGRRDYCAQMATTARDGYSSERRQSRLDLDSALLKAKMDTQVYGVGHGGRETADYYAQQTRNAITGQSAKDEASYAQFKTKSNEVKQCLADAEQQGKADYVLFKEGKASKAVQAQAAALITAWLTNLGEISTESPNGSEVTLTAWKSEKVRAEVSSLP